jgi:four helix bundle protein
MKSVINEQSFEFALKIIDLYKKLNNENEYVISKQLLRSGTSIGANIQEACATFSKSDFTYKMSLASE